MLLLRLLKVFNKLLLKLFDDHLIFLPKLDKISLQGVFVWDQFMDVKALDVILELFTKICICLCVLNAFDSSFVFRH